MNSAVWVLETVAQPPRLQHRGSSLIRDQCPGSTCCENKPEKNLKLWKRKNKFLVTSQMAAEKKMND
jgi:hypothetical protein